MTTYAHIVNAINATYDEYTEKLKKISEDFDTALGNAIEGADDLPEHEKMALNVLIATRNKQMEKEAE